MNKLIQIIYSSTAQKQLSVETLEGILTTSRKNNTDANITGMLLYRSGSFIQVLEGPGQQVKETYKRIEADSRHKNVTMLYEAELEQRDFPSWAMAFNGFKGEDNTGLSDFLRPFRSQDEARISEGAAKQLLKRFRQINKR